MINATYHCIHKGQFLVFWYVNICVACTLSLIDIPISDIGSMINLSFPIASSNNPGIQSVNTLDNYNLIGYTEQLLMVNE